MSKTAAASNPVLSRRAFLQTASGGVAAITASLSVGLPGSVLLGIVSAAEPTQPAQFEPVAIPDWVYDVTRMTFMGPGEIERAASAKVQVVHGNAVWPYFPLRRDGGGLPDQEASALKEFVSGCQQHGMKLVLGLPPFPAVELMLAHPDWRVHPDATDAALKIVPDKDNLATRLGCNLGPWGDYLIEICAELMEDYGVAGYSFDGNYHPPICYCPACQTAYEKDRGAPLPAKIDLNDVAYRQYLVWRGERLEDHYRRMQKRLKGVNPDAVLMSWTVNAGRYGHFLHSPRAMPTRLNLLFDLPMQEWWLDETNFGASVAPAFGAAYLHATTGGRPCAAEPYLMSRGNPYGTDSFPKHERLTRTMLATTNGCVSPESMGWPGHADSVIEVFQQISQRAPWVTRARRMPWAGMLVSEQTRQFYAYRDIAGIYLPHVFGAFRAGMEEHLAVNLLNDWDVNPDELARYQVVILPNAAALSDAQVAAVREYVQGGGGLVATAESSLFDELGRPRHDFALADVLGVSYRGRPQAPEKRPELDANFAITVDENYWQQRVGAATLSWIEHPLFEDAKLAELVPGRSARLRAPLVVVSEPQEPSEVVGRLLPEGDAMTSIPGIVCRKFGAGRVVYFAAGLDAALWSYAYPYQRCLLRRALEFAARQPFPISVTAPMCVQATYFMQGEAQDKRLVLHLFNGMNTTANHGLPAMDVPLREEVVPIHGIQVRIRGEAPERFHLEPGGAVPAVRWDEETTTVELPPLEIHAMLVGEYS